MIPTTSTPILLSRRRALASASLLATGALLSRVSPEASAQESTPAVSGGVEIDGAPGVWAEVYSGVPSSRAPDQTLYLARFTFFPQSEIFPHGHPGMTSLSVDRGEFSWTLVAGTTYVIRGAKSGATEVETVSAPGTEIILSPGDAIHYEDDVVHTARCAGDEAAIVHATLLLTSGEPLLMPMEAGMDH